MNPLNISAIGGLGAASGLTGLTSTSTLGGAAAARSLAEIPGMPPMSMDSLFSANKQQEQVIQEMLKILVELLKNGGGQGAAGGGEAGGYGGGGAVGSGSSGQPGDIINTGGASNTGASVTDSGPVVPGTEGLLAHANQMVGMHENSDTAAIQQVTGQSGINPSTTPWCAAWAMNLLEDHGVMDLDGLSNRNYCPTIKSWSQGKGTWGENGQYTPKPGDAILFDWEGDGTADHIGIVEKVENGKVYTIEGNSSDSVKKNTYNLGDGKIDGYVQSKGKTQAQQK